MMKVEAGCLALEQAAVGTPDEPVPGDLEGGPGRAHSMRAASWQRCVSRHKDKDVEGGHCEREKLQSVSQVKTLESVNHTL